MADERQRKRMTRSLRTRPQTLYHQDAPPVPSAPIQHHHGGGGGGGGGGSSSSSNVKKRLSKRYAGGAPNFSAPPPVPALPDGASMPDASLLSGRDRHAARERDDALAFVAARSGGRLANTEDEAAAAEAEWAYFSSEKFEPQAYLRAVSGVAGGGLRSNRAKDNLLAVKTRAAEELKKEVCANYADFIWISKEVSQLENDMIELKHTLREWSSIPATLKDAQQHASASAAAAEAASASATSRALPILSSTSLAFADDDMAYLSVPGALDAPRDRDSKRLSALPGGAQGGALSDLSSLWEAQIRAIWASVSGAEKYVPLGGDRHVVADAPGWVQLNIATYRPIQPVHLVLLDDRLLIATPLPAGGDDEDRRRSKRMSMLAPLSSQEVAGNPILRAERCFALADIVVIDLRDGPEVAHAIRIRRRKETYVYAARSATAKKSLLNAFRQVAQRIANTARQQHQSHHLDPNDSRGVDAVAVLRDVLPTATSSASRSPDALTPKDLITDWSDELIVAIALRSWDEAVGLVKSGRSAVARLEAGPGGAKPTFVSLDMRRRLGVHGRSLSQALVAALRTASAGSKRTEMAALVKHLTALGPEHAEAARSAFLAGRSATLSRRTRLIRPDGDAAAYIAELALVTFTAIRHGAEYYFHAFRDSRMASGFVKWAAAQVAEYAETVRRQVYSSLPESQQGLSVPGEMQPEAVRQALKISTKSATQLREVGLDFVFLLQELLRPDNATDNSRALI